MEPNAEPNLAPHRSPANPLTRLFAYFFGRNARAQVQLLTNQRVITDKCIVAKCFHTRLMGLIGRTSLETGEGMLFPKCNSISMWFMRIPIEVIFITDRKITSVHENVKPWRAFPLIDARGTDALELPPGTIRHYELKPGDELCIIV